MNKLNIIIDSVLGAAVIALYVIFFVNKSSNAEAPIAEASQASAYNDSCLADGVMPIAYLNIDSLLQGYTLAQKAQEQLMSKQEDARVKMNSKLRTLQNEMADFQRKYENNAFLTQERAQSEYQRLQRKEQELQELEQQLTNEIMMENQKLNLQLADSLTAFLKVYNANGRFQMILSNQGKDNVLMSAEGMNITADVIAGMNARYKK